MSVEIVEGRYYWIRVPRLLSEPEVLVGTPWLLVENGQERWMWEICGSCEGVTPNAVLAAIQPYTEAA